MLPRLLAGAAALALAPPAAEATPRARPHVETVPFGRLPDGRAVALHRLTNRRGMVVELTGYGAAITRIALPTGGGGDRAEMVVSPPDLAGLVASRRRFGAIVGRYAGRLRGAALVDGIRYPLATNASGVTLHGGDPGLDRALWSGRSFSTREAVGVAFTYLSRHGEQGFPGNLRLIARYALARAANVLTLDIVATVDRPTVANLTNHVYFNLAGGGTIACHLLHVDADRRVELDARKLPTGALSPTRGGSSDFSTADALGEAPGIDDMLVLRQNARILLRDPHSGRSLSMSTNQPGLQVFTGNGFDGTDRDRLGRPIPQYGGIALEPGHYPDSPWIAHFPSTRVAPGRPLRWRTSWAFGSGTPIHGSCPS